MPLRVIKTRLSKDVVTVSAGIAALISDVSDVSQFPPARAAALIILVILETLQEIENNRDACFRLAKRSAKILLDIKSRMEGRWDTAPRTLIRNIMEYESVLVSIRDFMLSLTRIKWIGRLLQKGSIEESIKNFNELLSDAENSFQTASLIEIHYTVELLRNKDEGKSVAFIENIAEDSTIPALENGPISSSSIDFLIPYSSSPHVVGPSEKESRHDLPNPEIEPTFDALIAEEAAELNKLGFKRYHQSDVQLLSEIRSLRGNTFWEQTHIGDAEGRKTLVKHYNPEARGKEKWLHDVKMLKSLYHPNLPQLFGFSYETSQTPFLLLSHVKLHDLGNHITRELKNEDMTTCTLTLLQMYRDISSAVTYVQRQLGYDETGAQVFIDDASYAYDIISKKVIVGLPPPQKENCYRGYGYSLLDSLSAKLLKILPKESDIQPMGGSITSDDVELQRKISHVKALAFNFLPKPENKPVASKLLDEVLEDSEDMLDILPGFLRLRAINAGIHSYSWTSAVHTCKYDFEVGDLGYILRDNDQDQNLISDDSRFHKFVKIGNIFDTEYLGNGVVKRMNIVKEVTGNQSQWSNNTRRNYDIWPFLLSEDVEGWPVSLAPYSRVEIYVRHSSQIASVSEAWRFLMNTAEEIANSAGISPHEIILITKTISGQVYKLDDRSPRAPALPHSFSRPTSPGYFPQHFHQPNFAPPRLIYLFTSHKSNFNVYWADSPTTAPTSVPPHSVSNVITLSKAWGKPEAFIGYIQLSNEDFKP